FNTTRRKPSCGVALSLDANEAGKDGRPGMSDCARSAAFSRRNRASVRSFEPVSSTASGTELSRNGAGAAVNVPHNASMRARAVSRMSHLPEMKPVEDISAPTTSAPGRAFHQARRVGADVPVVHLLDVLLPGEGRRGHQPPHDQLLFSHEAL